MEKVWITGGTGFFGKHISARLGPRSLITKRSDLDLLNREEVERYIRNADFNSIVHAAGFVGGMQLMKSQPERMYELNFRMGENLLRASAANNRMHVVLIGTALCYPENAQVPTQEEELFQGKLQQDTAAYGQAKLDLLKLALEKNLSFTCLIPTNMYGPGNHLEPERSNVIASLFLRALHAQQEGHKTLSVWGTGNETRDFLYVEDAAQAVAITLDKKPESEAVNIGSGKETSIAELAQMICKIVGFEGELVFDPSKGGGASRRCLDSSKAEKLLGFKAATSLEEGLRKTYAWIKTQL